jgi:iron complex outermembrane receptor protein
VDLPARTLVDLGARYRFDLQGRDVTVRGRISNVFDVYGFDLRGSGVYDLIQGRTLSLSLAMDL